MDKLILAALIVALVGGGWWLTHRGPGPEAQLPVIEHSVAVQHAESLDSTATINAELSDTSVPDVAQSLGDIDRQLQSL